MLRSVFSQRPSAIYWCGARFASAAKILYNPTDSVRNNLAYENMLIDNMKVDCPILFLWRNSTCVILGRNQNAWRECNIEKLNEDGVTLARRYTGGGAVYQDLGNSCFTFVAPNSKFDKTANNQLILDVLKDFGIEGSISGRNDLVVGDKKFSGQSFKHFEDISLHNGTILFSVEKDGLAKYLTPDKSKLEAKGVTSVAARVVNLTELNPKLYHETFHLALARKFAEKYGIEAPESLESIPLIRDELEKLPNGEETIQKHLKTLHDWDFVYGNSPPFSHHLGVKRLEGFGTFEVSFKVGSKAKIEAAYVYSDCLDVNFIDSLRSTLNSECVGERYESAVVTAALKTMGEKTGKVQECNRLAEWIGPAMEQ